MEDRKLDWVESNDQVWLVDVGPFHLMVGKCFVPGRDSNPAFRDPNAYKVLVGLDWASGERRFGIGANQGSRVVARDEVPTLEGAKDRAVELLAREAAERNMSGYEGEDLVTAELTRIKRTN